MVRVKMLRGLRVVNGDGGLLVTHFRTRKVSLLAFLAVNRGRDVSRSELTALLWPNADDETGHNRLKQAVAVLRRDLETAGIASEGKSLQRPAPLDDSSWADHCDRQFFV